MKKLLTLFFATIIYSGVMAQGIEFHHITWDEAIELAQKEDKIIFVDAYTTWCGPCKRMSANVFTQSEVGNFYNKNFVNLKLDMEQTEGRKFGKKYPVSAYPTLYYISPNGKVVQNIRGAQNVEKFIDLGKKALLLNDNSGDYAEEYDKGNRDPKLILKYIKSLNKAGKSSSKIANEYLRGQKDLSSEQNLLILNEATTYADSYVFGVFIKNRNKVEAVTSKEAVEEKIMNACMATANKAIEFESRDLLEEAWNKMGKHYPEKADGFMAKTEMKYSLAFKDGKSYLKAARKYAKKEIADNPDELTKVAVTVVQKFKGDKKAMNFAEDCAKQAATISGKYDYELNYAGVLFENGKKDEAVKIAEQALVKAKEVGPKASVRVEMFLKKIKGGRS
jgi:thioredoxin-related protein